MYNAGLKHVHQVQYKNALRENVWMEIKMHAVAPPPHRATSPRTDKYLKCMIEPTKCNMSGRSAIEAISVTLSTWPESSESIF